MHAHAHKKRKRARCINAHAQDSSRTRAHVFCARLRFVRACACTDLYQKIFGCSFISYELKFQILSRSERSLRRYLQNSTDTRQVTFFSKIEKCPFKTGKKGIKGVRKQKKAPHPKNLQCITRIYRYVGARMMHFNKNESKIKILKNPIVWEKISKTSILDHIYIYIYIYILVFCQ